MEPYRNDQEVFDAVAKHLLVQNQKSEVANQSGIGNNKCLYRHPNGLKCAIGALIPDDLYSTKMEGLPVDDVLSFPDLYDLFIGVDPDMLECLQEMHDNYKPEEWHDQLCRIADSYELSPSILEEV